MTLENFGADYFQRGVETGVSNYTDYRWLPDQTIRMAVAIQGHLGIARQDEVLDFGCARGYLVKAFRILGIDAAGKDISQWAIENCDPEVKEFVSIFSPGEPRISPIYDWVIAKDVLEHIPLPPLEATLKKLVQSARRGVFIVVPLTRLIDGDYVCPRDNLDKTHVIRWPLSQWLLFVHRFSPDCIVSGSHHVPGIKQASKPWPRSCGFITAKRLKRL